MATSAPTRFDPLGLPPLSARRSALSTAAGTVTGEEAFSLAPPAERPPPMLELWFLTGSARALAYGYLVAVEYDPSGGLALDFSAVTVRITGRNLGPLFTGLAAQRVTVVREEDELQAAAREPDTVTRVTRISVEAHGR